MIQRYCDGCGDAISSDMFETLIFNGSEDEQYDLCEVCGRLLFAAFEEESLKTRLAGTDSRDSADSKKEGEE